MNEKSRHELDHVKLPRKEESRVVIPRNKNKGIQELGELAELFSAVKAPIRKPTTEQWEKARTRVMEGLHQPAASSLTTLKDKILATDSVACRCLLYLAVLMALGILAVSAYFLFQELIPQTAEAAVHIGSYLA